MRRVFRPYIVPLTHPGGIQGHDLLGGHLHRFPAGYLHLVLFFSVPGIEAGIVRNLLDLLLRFPGQQSAPVLRVMESAVQQGHHAVLQVLDEVFRRHVAILQRSFHRVSLFAAESLPFPLEPAPAHLIFHAFRQVGHFVPLSVDECPAPCLDSACDLRDCLLDLVQRFLPVLQAVHAVSFRRPVHQQAVVNVLQVRYDLIPHAGVVVLRIRCLDHQPVQIPFRIESAVLRIHPGQPVAHVLQLILVRKG